MNCARRWNPHYTSARELIAAGDIGELLQVTAYAQCGAVAQRQPRPRRDALPRPRRTRQLVVRRTRVGRGRRGEGDPQGNGYFAYDNGARGYLRATPTGAAAGWEFGRAGKRRAGAPAGAGPAVRVVEVGAGRSAGPPHAGAAAVPLPETHAGDGADHRRRHPHRGRERRRAALFRGRRPPRPGDRRGPARVPPPRLHPRRPAARRPLARHPLRGDRTGPHPGGGCAGCRDSRTHRQGGGPFANRGPASRTASPVSGTKPAHPGQAGATSPSHGPASQQGEPSQSEMPSSSISKISTEQGGILPGLPFFL